MRRGFLLGKFMPPHAGHVGLCRVAMGQCDHLSVLVCTRDVEPIPGSLRAAWMAELMPAARILHVHRDIPQEPKEHPAFWTIWRELIFEQHPEPIHRVFGSEAYVVRLAAELGAEPVVVDPERLAFPVSAAAVRADPPAHWHHIPGPIRPWYQKRVVLFGPESVGKSTLAARLGALCGGPYVPEYGRTYDRFRDGGEWRHRDFLRIAEGHLAIRAAVAPAAGPVLVEDTDPLLTSVWARMLTGSSIPELEDETRLGDLYLLLDTDAPWTDDGTRYFSDNSRAQFMNLCRDILERRGARYLTISGDWTARWEQAVAALEALRQEPYAGRWTLPQSAHPVI